MEAVKQAVSSPLLETTIEGASHVIINISGDISLIEANEAASFVQEMAGITPILSLALCMMRMLRMRLLLR